MNYRRKLVETSLPIGAINDASAYDKLPGIGPHPKNLHWWWARLPLPAARVFLFASLVDDPGEDGVPPELLRLIDTDLNLPQELKHLEIGLSDMGPEQQADVRRKKLHTFIDQLAIASHKGGDPSVIVTAQHLIHAACEGRPPLIVDPFCGGGSIPLEATRLGLDSEGGDLNPVAVLISKAQLDLPKPFAGKAPVHPSRSSGLGVEVQWRGFAGLAEDVRKYGDDVKQAAQTQIGSCYPNLRDQDGIERAPICYLWCRTVVSPSPSARGAHTPLIKTLMIRSKGRVEEKVWLELLVKKDKFAFNVHLGQIPEALRAGTKDGTKTGRGASFRCVFSGTPIPETHIKNEAKAGRLGSALLATVYDANGGRSYSVDPLQQDVALGVARPVDLGCTDIELPDDMRNVWIKSYGFATYSSLFSNRQLLCIITFSSVIRNLKARIICDAQSAGLTSDDAEIYAKTVTTYLTLALGRLADFNNTCCRWKPSGEQIIQLFSRQTIPLVWDTVECNPFSMKGVGWTNQVNLVSKALEQLPVSVGNVGIACQQNATTSRHPNGSILVSTDPPYYNAISYAELSDFFYLWHRRTLEGMYPDIHGTIATPKKEELIAHPGRHGGDDAAASHFERGFKEMFSHLHDQLDERFPMTIYYAFNQQESDGTEPDDASDDEGSTGKMNRGWDTILQALVDAGQQVTGTIPVRAAQKWRIIGMGTNALASYIVIACRPRPADAPTTLWPEFREELRNELEGAILQFLEDDLAPVDLAQAAIGPGMAVFTRYREVLTATGSTVKVKQAIQLINQLIEDLVSGSDTHYDPETRFAVAWFDSYGFSSQEYGLALQLATATGVTVSGLKEAGLVVSERSRVKLKSIDELVSDYHPGRDRRATAWEATHYLARELEKGSVQAAATMMRRYRDEAPHIDLGVAKELAVRLYQISNKKRWASEATMYNTLGANWNDILKRSEGLAAGPANNLFTGEQA